MGGFFQYLRARRWQRGLLTISLSVVVGVAGGLVGYPIARDYMIIHDLGSEDPAVRAEATTRAIQLAKANPTTLGRLNDALDTPSDRRFTSIVRVLSRLGKFRTPGRKWLHIDRLNAIDLESAATVKIRQSILTEVILAGRDNQYVRRALRAASSDAAAEVRALSAVLAGRVGDKQTLHKLLGDKDTSVVARSAEAAGIARLVSFRPELIKLLNSSNDREVISAAAFALTQTPRSPEEQITSYRHTPGTLLRTTKDTLLRDRLLHVMSLTDDEQSRKAVTDVIAAATKAGKFPPAMAIVAAGKLKLKSAGPVIRRMLADAVRKDTKLYDTQLLAALGAAEQLKLPCRREVELICRTLWNPELDVAMRIAARLLGAQATDQLHDSKAPSLEQCIRTLQMAATYDMPPNRPRATPVASGAAATALWKLKAPRGEELLRAAVNESSTAGDYVAWHLGIPGGNKAFRLGLAMLPPPRDPLLPLDRQPPRVYSTHQRAAGAMLLALAAASDEQKSAAVRRIRSRLEGGPTGARERDKVLISTLKCALLMLGQEQTRPAVLRLFRTERFPWRRIITALLVVGDKAALDRLLWNWQLTPEDVVSLVVDECLSDVLAACGCECVVDAAAEADLRLWQVRLAADTYAIRRAEIHPKLRR